MVVSGSEVLCHRGIDGPTVDIVQRFGTTRGLHLPDELRGSVLVVEPNGTALVVALVPAPSVTPLRLPDDTWALLGAQSRDGERFPVLPASWVAPDKGAAVATRPVGDGQVVAFEALPALWPYLVAAAVTVVPLALVWCLRRSTVRPLADLVTHREMHEPVAVELTALRSLLDDEALLRRELVLSIESARDEERRRLAVELHDDAIQELSAAMILLEVGARDDPAVFGQVVRGVEETTASLRTVTSGLLATSLSRHGLYRSLVDETEFLVRDSGLVAEVCVDDPVLLDGEVPSDLARLLLRNTLEAVRNAVEHSKGTRVSVSAGLDAAGQVWTQVQDDGLGTTEEDLAAARDSGHIGMASMRTLIQSAGGTLRVTSDGGTTVRIELPLEAPGART